MSRVTPIESSALPADLAGIYEQYAGAYGPFRNQAAVFAHVQSSVRHVFPLLMELKSQQNLKWRYVELAIVVVSKVNECHYCVAHHAPMLRVEGLSDAGIERVLDYATHPEFDEVDRTVVEYAIQVTREARRVSERLFARMREHFTEAQIVELTLRIALCGFFNRFNDALQIDEEADVLHGI